jgi:hypothetical protein
MLRRLARRDYEVHAVFHQRRSDHENDQEHKRQVEHRRHVQLIERVQALTIGKAAHEILNGD